MNRVFFVMLVPLWSACGKGAEAPPPRPSWCSSALAEITRSASVMPPRDLAPASIQALEALAGRMDQEREALSRLGDAEALEYAADAARWVSVASFSLVSCRHVDRGDTPSAERALGLTLRARERAVLVVQGHCGGVTPARDQSEDWQKKVMGIWEGLAPEIRACGAQLAPEEKPPRIDILAHVDAQGRVTLATPVHGSFEPGKWGLVDAVHCVVRRLEATKFPEPEGSATVLVPLVRDTPP